MVCKLYTCVSVCAAVFYSLCLYTYDGFEKLVGDRTTMRDGTRRRHRWPPALLRFKRACVLPTHVCFVFKYQWTMARYYAYVCVSGFFREQCRNFCFLPRVRKWCKWCWRFAGARFILDCSRAQYLLVVCDKRSLVSVNGLTRIFIQVESKWIILSGLIARQYINCFISFWTFKLFEPWRNVNYYWSGE